MNIAFGTYPTSLPADTIGDMAAGGNEKAPTAYNDPTVKTAADANKSGNKWIMYVLVALILAAIAFGVFYYVKAKKSR